MKKYFYSALILYITVFNINLFSQAPEIMWTRTFGSTNPDYGYSVQETNDGGFIIAGSTYIGGSGGYQVWIIKTDSTGNPLWTKTYGDILSDVAYCVSKTNDGGFIIAGSVGVPSAAGISDAFLLRIDNEGNTVWYKTYGQPGDHEIGNFTEQCSDGGFILAGFIADTSSYTSNFLVIKTDSLGNSEWVQTYGGNSNEEAYCIRQVSPVGYIISGVTDSYGAGGHDAWVLRIDDMGNTIWARTFGGFSTEFGYSTLQTPDGGFVVTGITASFGNGSLDAWLIKLNNAGDTLWTKTYGGSESEGGNSIQQTADNGFIITGWTDSFGSGFDDVLIIRTNESGDTLWTKVIGGSSEERGQSVCQASDGGYIVAGYTRSFGSGNGDIYLIRIDSDITTTNINDLNSNSLTSFQLFQNYPNPFNPTTKIGWQSSISSRQTLKIFDVLGNVVATLVDGYKPAGTYEVEFNASDIPSGIYFYQLKSGSNVQTKKLTLIK